MSIDYYIHVIYLLAKFSVDTAENGPLKVYQQLGKSFQRVRQNIGEDPRGAGELPAPGARDVAARLGGGEGRDHEAACGRRAPVREPGEEAPEGGREGGRLEEN